MNNIAQIELDGVNSYLLKAGDGFILVDTGGHLIMDKEFTNRRSLLRQKLEAAGCGENNIKCILLTHGDNDHTCNAAYFRKLYCTKIAMHENDRELVEQPSLPQWMKSFRYRSVLFRIVFRILNKKIKTVTQKTLDDFEPFSPDILLTDGFDLSPYGLSANVLHTPGHTPGSVGILLENGDFISGDTFANIKKPETAANGYDFGLLQESTDRLKKYGVKKVYPGHGKAFMFDELFTAGPAG